MKFSEFLQSRKENRPKAEKVIPGGKFVYPLGQLSSKQWLLTPLLCDIAWEQTFKLRDSWGKGPERNIDLTADRMVCVVTRSSAETEIRREVDGKKRIYKEKIRRDFYYIVDKEELLDF